MNAQNRFWRILRSVALPSLIAAGTSRRRLFISTTSAASIATSAPAPMAMPTSAVVSAGASLMPSPTMAVLPSRHSRSITAALPSGRTPAMTSSTPAFLPMAAAVFSLSPVSMTTRSPIFFSSATAAGLSSLMTSATAMTPRTLFPLEKYNGVFPSSAQRSAAVRTAAGTAPCCSIKLRLPPQRSSPFWRAVKPLPAWVS